MKTKLLTTFLFLIVTSTQVLAARPSINALNTRVNQLEAENNAQQAEIDTLDVRVTALEEALASTARFTDMGNGTIRDNDSGLIWLKDASCEELPGMNGQATADWDTAKAAAAALANGICGLTDESAAGVWRLPTKEEWEAFMSPVFDSPALVNTLGNVQWSEGDAFTGVQSNAYWSTQFDGGSAWIVDMISGNTAFGDFSFSLYVWPVRNMPPEPTPGVCDGTLDDEDCINLPLCEVAESYMFYVCGVPGAYTIICGNPNDSCIAQCILDADCGDIFSLSSDVPDQELTQCLNSCN